MTTEAAWPREAGVMRPELYETYSEERPLVERVYQDADINVVVWNLLPGQMTDVHKHPQNVHAFIVLCGEGEYVQDQEEPVTICAGNLIIIPRDVVHLVRNTGDGPLSYLAVTSIGLHGYARA